MIRTLFNFTFVRTYLIVQAITRIVLNSYALWHDKISIYDVPSIFLVGTVNDLLSICYCLPLILILTIILHKLLIRCKTLHLIFCFFAYFLTIILLILISSAEIIFWDEFGTRFNFIAVDYLIYTHEIIGTIKESLPFIEILFTTIIIAIIIIFICRKHIINKAKNLNIKQCIIYAIILFCCDLFVLRFYNTNKFTFSTNKYVIELGKNGCYEFFSAFYNNTLDYNSVYPTIDNSKALKIVRTNLLQENQTFFNDNNIDRHTSARLTNNKKYNVVFIMIESLSSEFMGKFGNKHNITPYLDKLADDSIFFTNLYATGTRTVRGLEAITLSTPPTPGSSIIRRPNNQSLFNIGTVFKKAGYNIHFFFGGYSYFDNLQNYFYGNGYNIIDRSDLKSSEISFANIWGVADEDILLKSLEVADQNYKDDKSFFSLIMTTSNHRPYTFPSNRIDVPSGSGRNGAVKYTDYAIDKFLELAKTRPWFDNTIFVITADHCASSAGKTDLPINKYHIPLIIYAPKILQPQQINSLASQIDIGPTILGLLDFEYDSKFFGRDILNFPAQRAFISTYQLLGFLKSDHLVILSPKEQPKTYKLIGYEKQQVTNLPNLVEEAISLYQTAYDFYIQGKMKE